MSLKHARRKLYEYVVDELGLRIIRGDYRPGETLPNEDRLCQELDVSRGVLREAIKVLIQKGLLEARPKTGTLILPHSSWNVFDPEVLLWTSQTGNKVEFLKNLMEVRRIIEPEAAKLAAERAGAEDIERMWAIYNEMSTMISTETGSPSKDFIRLDLTFHAVILEACANELLAQIGHTMRHALLTARQSDRADRAAQQAALASHLAMLQAITNHDPGEAYRIAQTHVDEVWGEMQQQMAEEDE